MIRSEKAFLPEIDAYIDYFKKKKIEIYDSKTLDMYNINDYDVIWEFKGFGGVNTKERLLIHDYASLSTGKLPKLKNMLKAMANPKPDIRIFLNNDVMKEFNFYDNIDYCYRDMGINDNFLNFKSSKKEYEFVYIGSISKERQMDKFIGKINKQKIGRVCFIGDVDFEIYKQYKFNKDFTFVGKINHNDIPDVASRSIYGINYIPNKYPYNLQTSTKLLEYLALGLNVVTTNYKWINDFEIRNSCKFYKINDFEINLQELEKFDFKNDIDMEDFLWDNIIDKSGIYKKIISKF